MLSLTLPQEPHVKDAATEGAAKEQNKRQEKRKPCRAKADVGLMYGVMHVYGQDPDVPTEGWAVACRKKRPQKQKTLPPVSEKALQPVRCRPRLLYSRRRRLLHAGTLGASRRPLRTVFEPRGSKKCWTPRWPWRLTSGTASWGRVAPHSSRCTRSSRECV